MTNNSTRRRFLKTAGVAGVAALAGCGGGGDGGDGGDGGMTETDGDGGDGGMTETDGDGGDMETRLSWHAGGTGGTYFPLSNEFKTVVEENTDFTLNVQSTGASVENVGSLASGDADFALIQNDIASFARNGEGIDAFQGNAVENLRGVATLYPETITVVTLADTGITQLSDLEGATINTGDLGSGTQVNALQILESVGISDFTEQNASFSQAADQLRNGDIDAAFVVGGWPVGAIEDLANTNDLVIVPISGDNRDAAKEDASWFANDTIPAGTYTGVDEAVETIAVQAMIATNAEQPEQTVESVTAAIFDNVDDLSIKTDFISKDSAQDGMSIELHPGAAAYFDA
ncbi:C4-dicarboxylate ABC transporter substrate-binding protein [Haloarcula taiwanensis]|uniref:C4-dicarboxylate ABC transporter substrate-binding protein n=1 Tax=Haloarcula taiwanensis TaxID=1932004 RepID=A0A2H5A1U2_9EURY|nr:MULTISPECIES: TAXI family TRAP transporter solute-binding subunit [Haloarcula]AUG48694.1 C4-dicarboxylate ABC transporter substrate-binding protein [Haloarcula taiwanensis]RLM40026.1 C4-dicarboxylate ABC transporter substrate-binding protein [Haloarcula sp. Atlit-120R]RLM48043.1 C4-dicarboxylate ABC transporter substrate-binding protein [Haloarcula sp. Atlit-47R]